MTPRMHLNRPIEPAAQYADQRHTRGVLSTRPLRRGVGVLIVLLVASAGAHRAVADAPASTSRVVEAKVTGLKVFYRPAVFTLPRFGRYGVPLEPVPHVVIAEGMQFKVEPSNGKYTLEYTVQTPATTVILNLQLLLHHSDGCVYTLTLPPKTLIPLRDEKGRDKPDWVPVKVQGTVPGGASGVWVKFDPQHLARTGVARIGAGVESPSF